MPSFPIWLWLNTLGLDAPIIAVLWQNAFALAFGVPVIFSMRMGLFCVVWTVYLGDRLADGMRLNITEHSADRHQFAARHRILLMVLLAMALLGAGYAALLTPKTVLIVAFTLGASTVLYFLWNQMARGTFSRKYFKEIIISLIFTLGTTLIPALQGAATNQGFVVGTVLFFMLCLANCAIISRIERAVDIARGEESYAIHFAQNLTPGRWLSAAVMLLAVIFGIMRILPESLALPLGLSGMGLFFIVFVERIAGSRFAVSWADICLMTPVLVLAVKSIH